MFFFILHLKTLTFRRCKHFRKHPTICQLKLMQPNRTLAYFVCFWTLFICCWNEWGGDGLVNSRGLWVGYHFMWCMFVSCCSVFYSLPKVDSFGFKLQATKRLFSLSLQQKERNAADVSSDFFFCKQLLFQDYIRFWTTALISMWFPWTRCNNTHHPSSTVLIPFDLLPNDALARWKV